MSHLQDLFRYEEERDDNELEQIVEQDREHDAQQSDEGQGHSEAEEEAPRRIDPTQEKKVKVVKNPRPMLNPKRLTGPRGVQVIESVFQDFQFQGTGHEKDDLDLVMKKLEHWAHRLYPKFQFDDCLAKIAHLGKKKEVSVHVKKIRLNMIVNDEQIVQFDNDNDENPTFEPVRDEFDLLLDQQIALAKSTPAPNQIDNSITVTSPVPVINNDVSSQANNAVISSEQRQRMLQNKLLAEQRRLAKLQEKNNDSSDVVVVDDTNNVEEMAV